MSSSTITSFRFSGNLKAFVPIVTRLFGDGTRAESRSNGLLSFGTDGTRFEVIKNDYADISLRKISVRHCEGKTQE